MSYAEKYPEIYKQLKDDIERKLFELICEGWQSKGTVWLIGELKKLIKEKQ